MDLANFFNKISNNNRIFTVEDLDTMSDKEFQKNERAIDYQMGKMGIPTNEQMANSSDVVFVNAYTRADGTHVRAHYRSKNGSGNSVVQPQEPWYGMSESFIPNGEVSSGFPNASAPPVVMHANGGGEGAEENVNMTPWNSPYLPQSSVSEIIEMIQDPHRFPLSGEMTDMDKKIDNLGKWGCQFDIMNEKIFPVACSAYLNARTNLELAKNSKNAHILDSRLEITDKGLNDLFDEIEIPKNVRGVVFDANSLESKSLFRSREIQKYIRNNIENLLEKQNNPTENINFTLVGSFNNYLGLQHCKLYNPHVTPDGYFNGMIVDYYDFEHRKGVMPQIYINNWGHSMQERGFMENHFLIYEIREKLW